MKNVFVVLLVLGVTTLSGCAFLDAITGVNKPADSPPGALESAGTWLSSLPGWLGLIGTVIGAGGTTYKHFREKHYREALGSVVSGIDRALDGGTKLSVSKDELYAALKRAITDGVTNYEEVFKFIGEVKSAIRA